MPARTPRILRQGTIVALLIAAAMGSSLHLAQESPSYIMDRVTFGSTANTATSPTYETTVTAGQEGPVGSVSVCNDGLFQSTGFWSLFGDPPADIWLEVLPNPSDSTIADLSWSGSAAMFEVFRSESPVSVPIPPNSFAVTSLCAASDGTPPVGNLVYYLVLPAGN